MTHINFPPTINRIVHCTYHDLICRLVCFHHIRKIPCPSLYRFQMTILEPLKICLPLRYTPKRGSHLGPIVMENMTCLLMHITSNTSSPTSNNLFGSESMGGNTSLPPPQKTQWPILGVGQPTVWWHACCL